MTKRKSTRFSLAALLLALSTGALLYAQDGPPHEAGPFRAPDLVEIVKLDPTIRLDIRYATKNNFLDRAVYTEARAFLQRPAAEALARVQPARSVHRIRFPSSHIKLGDAHGRALHRREQLDRHPPA